MNTAGGFQLIDLWGVARRRARPALWSALVVFLATFWVAMALPNEYESYATILVEPQAVSPELVESGVGNTDLTRRLGLMTAQILARPRLSRIVDDLGLYESESRRMVREEVIDRMRGAVRVEPVIPELSSRDRDRRREEIDTFRIFFTYRDAATAAAVAQELANNFIDRHIKARVEQSQKSLEFMQTELSRLAEEIRAVEARVAEVKATNSGRLPDDVNANHGRLERLAGQLSYAQRLLADAQSDEAFYRSQLSSAGLLGGGRDDEASPERRGRLLELSLSEMAARGFTEKHPDVIKTRLELAALRAQVQVQAQAQAQVQREPGDAGEPGAQTDGEKSFAQRSAEAELRRAEQRRAGAQQETERLAVQIAQVDALLSATPRVAEQLSVLEREYRHLFQSYQDFSNRKLEATVAAQLERRQLGEQFRVLETAFPAPAPSSPDRAMIIVLGAFFAAVLGGALGILLEAADSSVHTARQLQASLSIPVLAAIPEIDLESDRAANRRRQIRTAAAVVGLVSFALLGSAANYLWVNGQFGGGPAPRVPAAEGAPAPAPEPAALPDVPEGG